MQKYPSKLAQLETEAGHQRKWSRIISWRAIKAYIILRIDDHATYAATQHRKKETTLTSWWLWIRDPVVTLGSASLTP